MGRKSDPQGTVQKIKNDHDSKGNKNKSEYILENETHQIIWDIEINESNNLVQKSRPSINH